MTTTVTSAQGRGPEQWPVGHERPMAHVFRRADVVPYVMSCWKDAKYPSGVNFEKGFVTDMDTPALDQSQYV